MASLNGTTPATTFPSLIKFNDNSAISSTKRLLSDGDGGATPLYLSSTQLNIGGTGLINATLGAKGVGTTSATQSFKAENSTSAKYIQFGDDGKLGINISPTATTHIKGGGGVDHTTSSFRVENSANTSSFTFRDEGSFVLLGNNAYGGANTPILSMRDSYHEIFIGGSGFSNANYITQSFCFSGSMNTTRFQGMQLENGGLGGTLNATSGTYRAFEIIGSRFGSDTYGVFNPTSGTAIYKHININTGINQTGSASGSVYGIDYNPILTSILGTHYGILIRPKTFNGFGLGATLPTASVHIKGQTATSSTTNFKAENSDSTKSITFNDAGNLATNGNMAIGQTTPANSTSILELVSTTQGFLPPRMTTTQINAISSPANGLMVYNTTIDHLCVYQGGSWVKINHSPM